MFGAWFARIHQLRLGRNKRDAVRGRARESSLDSATIWLELGDGWVGQDRRPLRREAWPPWSVQTTLGEGGHSSLPCTQVSSWLLFGRQHTVSLPRKRQDKRRSIKKTEYLG
jgi:hypothetical protein